MAESSWRDSSLWLWFGAAVLAAPATIVLHELGHFIAAHTFGFPDVVLHHGSVSDGAAENGYPRWQIGLKAAAGPLVTLAVVLGCCYAVTKVGPRPWAIAPAFAAGLRSVAIGGAYMFTRLRFPGSRGNFDELNAARGLGLSADLVVAANVGLLVAAWVFLIRRIPQRRLRVLGATTAGAVTGLALYIAWLGPTLLP